MAVSKWCCRLIAHTMPANVCNVGLSYAWLGRSHVHSTSFAFVDDAKTYSRTSDSGGTNITFSILMKAHTRMKVNSLAFTGRTHKNSIEKKMN